PPGSFPLGYVEPRPEFWGTFGKMMSNTAQRLASLKFTKTNGIYLAETQIRQVSHFERFSTVLTRLENIARKELAGQRLGDDEQKFIENLFQEWDVAAGEFNPGWYRQLFYPSKYSDPDEALIADVHTDVPCLLKECGWDPGSVLHEAIGAVNLLILA